MSSLSNVSFAFFPTQMLSSGCLAFFVGSISHKHVENTLFADHFRVVTFVFCLPIFIWSQQIPGFHHLNSPWWLNSSQTFSFICSHVFVVTSSFRLDILQIQPGLRLECRESQGLTHQLSRRHRPRCAGDTPRKQIWSKSIHESFHMRIYIYSYWKWPFSSLIYPWKMVMFHRFHSYVSLPGRVSYWTEYDDRSHKS